MNDNQLQINKEACFFTRLGDADKDEVLQWVKTGNIPKGMFAR